MKVLLTGSAHQGKFSYAGVRYNFKPEEVYDAAVDPDFANRRVIRNLHLLVRNLLVAGADPQSVILSGLSQHEQWLIICDEIGCGIVPIDKTDRRWREETGRLCCILAQQADIVERITCGIPWRIKG